MKIKVPGFVPNTIRRGVFILIAWIIYAASFGILTLFLEDDEGFKCNTSD